MLSCSRTVTHLPLLIVTCLGCESGAVTLDNANGQGERRGLTVVAPVHPEFASIATELAWERGVPGVEVRLHRITTPIEDWIVAETDQEGRAVFPDLLPGYYRIAAMRVLEEQEASATGGRVRALADGMQRHLAEGDSLELTLRLDRPNSLVIREVYPPNPQAADAYDFGHYHVIHNNADTTVFLDGLVYGTTFNLFRDFDAFPCTMTEPFRTDSEGVFVAFLHEFPGSGSDFPVGPGESRVLALDAIDHREFSEFQPDLTGADFEFLGSSDVDNPSVPNLPEAGLISAFGGHGLRDRAPSGWLIANAIDVNQLSHMQICGQACADYALVPNEEIIDLVALYDGAEFDAEAAPCRNPVPRRFERLAGGFMACCNTEELAFSMQRKLLRTEDGREVLLNTDVSAVDFIKQGRSIP